VLASAKLTSGGGSRKTELAAAAARCFCIKRRRLGSGGGSARAKQTQRLANYFSFVLASLAYLFTSPQVQRARGVEAAGVHLLARVARAH
jgi:hypothetical protein